MHPALKQRLEIALSSSTASRISRIRLTGKRLILAYHGIIPKGEQAAGERSLFVRQEQFAAQLDALRALVEVVPLDRLDEPATDKPRVAITFDDGYRGAVNEGVRELVDRGMPATIFVAPGRLDGHSFWWDELSTGPSLNESVRNHALFELAGSDERVKSWAAASGLATCDKLPGYAQSATLDELRDALTRPGITVGSHTWSHINLAASMPSEVVAEISQSRDWLRSEFGEKALPWLAYPYGFDSPEIHQAVANASYQGAVRIEGGWHNASKVSPFARPRMNVPADLSLAGFRARIIGSLRT